MNDLPLEVKTLHNGNQILGMNLKLGSGTKILVKCGFTQCTNPLYWQKDNIIAHYNRLLKHWIIETLDNPGTLCYNP